MRVKALTDSNVGLLIPKSHRSNKSLIFDRPSGKIRSYEGGLGDHTLPSWKLLVDVLCNLFGHTITLETHRLPEYLSPGAVEGISVPHTSFRGHSGGVREVERAIRDGGLGVPFFAVFFPVLTTLNISSSAMPLTLGNGTENLAAFSFRLFFTKSKSASEPQTLASARTYSRYSKLSHL